MLSKKSKEENIIVIGYYTFIIKDRRLVVVSQNNHDEAELKTIAKLYAEYKRSKYVGGRPMAGKWQWCLNPECNNAFYARRYKAEKGQAVCCCDHCAGKVFGIQKGRQMGEPTSEPHRLASIWGLSAYEVKQAWDWLVEGKEREREGKLIQVEVLVFLLNALRDTEIDYLTASSADKLYCQRLGLKSPRVLTFYRYLDFLVEKMPGEIVVDKTSRPKIYLTPEKMPKIKAKREKEQREAAEKKEKLRRLVKQFISESEGRQPIIRSSLKKQGIVISTSGLLKLIKNDEELNQSLENAREARRKRLTEARLARYAIKYPGRERSASQIKELAAKEEAGYLPEATTKEKDLPLSEEEIGILLAYEKGDSAQVLADKTEKPGGRIDILITSILTRKHVATLDEAIEKSKEELIPV